MDRTGRTRLRHAEGYPRLYAAALLARVSNEMAPVAIVLLILEETGSAALAGLSAAAVGLPSIATGPLLGAILDRSARPARLLALEQTLAAASLATLAAAAGSLPEWLLPLVLLPAGVAFPLSTAGFTALVPGLVRRELLPRANAFEAASFNAGILAGPALAGALAVAASPRVAVFVEAGLKGAALALTLTIAAGGLQRARRAAAPLLRDVRAGLRHVAASGPLLAVTVAGGLSLGGRGLLTVAFPLYAAGSLGERPGFAGYLWAAFAAGSLAGALGSTRTRLDATSERVVLGSIALSGLAILLWPLAGAPLSALALVALAGAAYGPGFAATFGVRQRRTPRELHGQVFMTAASLKTGAFALGGAAAGAAATGLGVTGTLLLAGSLQLAAAWAGAYLLRARDRIEAATTSSAGRP